MIRNTLKKAAGLFVEFDEEKPAEWSVMDAPKTVEQIVKEQPGPNLEEIKVQAQPVTATPAPAPSEPVMREDGSVSFEAIYKLASLPQVPFTAEQILELFTSLPSDLPLDSKRATIKVTLGAMAKTLGVTTEQIIADASRKLAALASYSESFSKQAEDYISKSELAIIELEEQIAAKRNAIEVAKTKQSKVQESCQREGDRLDDVLEFFSLDVPPSKHAR